MFFAYWFKYSGGQLLHILYMSPFYDTEVLKSVVFLFLHVNATGQKLLTRAVKTRCQTVQPRTDRMLMIQ